MGIWGWLIGTKAGLSVLLGSVLLIGVTASYLGFKKHHFDRGVASCEAAHAKAVADANVKQAAENLQRNTDASTIAKDADTAGQKVSQDITTNTTNAKKEIRNEYKAPPRNAPIAYRSCVHPVPARVQKSIRQAVDSANGK